MNAVYSATYHESILFFLLTIILIDKRLREVTSFSRPPAAAAGLWKTAAVDDRQKNKTFKYASRHYRTDKSGRMDMAPRRCFFFFPFLSFKNLQQEQLVMFDASVHFFLKIKLQQKLLALRSGKNGMKMPSGFRVFWLFDVFWWSTTWKKRKSSIYFVIKCKTLTRW